MSLKYSLNHNDTKSTMANRQRGSALIMAIFVITVMFLLASALINIVSDGDDSLNQEVLGTRALATANSGADAALARLFPLAGGVTDCAIVTTPWTPPTSVGFSGCKVTLACANYVLGSETQYRITSEAVCESGPMRVRRQVEVEARGN
ncbi:MSHA biogenesis protein MshP [Shewanella sp. SR44-3]|uniref:MSHA biogenesis protein MshP n=1 Tax=unclassified Shewanella TaxID=196818 RepID=UPI0015FD4804|nr:MSHA biogenesis protein MshP [Shewanella sp. SR44-3]MBB1269651.1 MSHA biogenesis protein MshP [Shewanella sp. SR44-3]